MNQNVSWFLSTAMTTLAKGVGVAVRWSAVACVAVAHLVARAIVQAWWGAVAVVDAVMAIYPARWNDTERHRASAGYGAMLTLALTLLVCLCAETMSSCAGGEGGDAEEDNALAEIIGESVSAPVASGPCNARCREAVRRERQRITPIEENEASYVLREYNVLVRSSVWRDRAKRCAEIMPVFETAQSYSLHPAPFIAGISLVESEGCRFLTAHNGDGGVGPMQITSKDLQSFAVVGGWLGMTTEEVTRANCHHVRGEARRRCAREADQRQFLVNVLTGSVMLDAGERSLQSRGPALIAYNRGGGNVRKDMGKVLDDDASRRHRTISEFRGAIPCPGNGWGCARKYADKVLAGAVLVDRAHRGLPLVELESLRREDIPGWNPALDDLPASR